MNWLKDWIKVNPKQDALKDRKSSDISAENNDDPKVFTSKKYYSQHKSLSVMRYLALILALMTFALLALLIYDLSTPESNEIDLNTFGLFLGGFSVLLSAVIFFVSFSLNYTNHQKEEYEFYYNNSETASKVSKSTISTGATPSSSLKTPVKTEKAEETVVSTQPTNQ